MQLWLEWKLRCQVVPLTALELATRKRRSICVYGDRHRHCRERGAQIAVVLSGLEVFAITARSAE
jgi:hypothetical protein